MNDLTKSDLIKRIVDLNLADINAIQNGAFIVNFGTRPQDVKVKIERYLATASV